MSYLIVEQRTDSDDLNFTLLHSDIPPSALRYNTALILKLSLKDSLLSKSDLIKKFYSNTLEQP